MPGGYPCCCQERFGSSVSGAESGELPPPGSLVLNCDCNCICGGNGPEIIRVDLNVPDDVPVNCAWGKLKGKRCPELSGTYFALCLGTCHWLADGDPQLWVSWYCGPGGVSLLQVYLNSRSCIPQGTARILSFLHEFTPEEMSDDPFSFTGAKCVDPYRINGLVLGVDPWMSGVDRCDSPNATATLYLP